MSATPPLSAVVNTVTTHHTLSDFDFELPPELIAQHPAAVRSGSRLLDGSSAAVVDRIFNELPGLLNAGDLLVFNDTKVVKARIFGEKATGGKLELLIERVLPGTHEVWAHMRASKSPKPGATVRFADTPPSVAKRSSRETWGSLAKRLLGLVFHHPEDQGLSVENRRVLLDCANYVREGDPEVNKNALLADRSHFTDEQLAAMGVKFESEEIFYIEPKIGRAHV